MKKNLHKKENTFFSSNKLLKSILAKTFVISFFITVFIIVGYILLVRRNESNPPIYNISQYLVDNIPIFVFLLLFIYAITVIYYYLQKSSGDVKQVPVIETGGIDEIIYLKDEEKFIEASTAGQIFNLLTYSRRRVEEEISSQNRRGNINLLIGITTALIGLFILGYSVFTINSIPTADIKDINKDIIHLAYSYIPRLSLVFLIEVFAYFFLRLYKYSIIEIKYFQNELTNIDLKTMALHLVGKVGDKDQIKEIAMELVKTERNFILEKGQSTVELEIKQNERNAMIEAVSLISGILNKGKGPSTKGKKKS